MCAKVACLIREIRKEELPILEDMLYDAIFQPAGAQPLPREIVWEPEIRVYIDRFGGSHDHCLVAVVDKLIVGAAWARIMKGKGYGNIDDQTPELVISLKKAYRNLGIGTELMRAMIDYLRRKGYAKASLSVDKNNYAVKLYRRLGFQVVEDRGRDYLMLLYL